jgi:hypothetical protein
MDYFYKNRGAVSRVRVTLCPFVHREGCRKMKNPSGRALYLTGKQMMTMKKQTMQKTQGHKTRDHGDPSSPGPSKAAGPVTRGQIDSLRDKSAAKKKKGKR